VKGGEETRPAGQEQRGGTKRGRRWSGLKKKMTPGAQRLERELSRCAYLYIV
jgi:hypothetical protein